MNVDFEKIIIEKYINYLVEICNSITNKKIKNEYLNKINEIYNSDWRLGEKFGKHETSAPVKLTLFIIHQDLVEAFPEKNIIWYKEYKMNYIRKEKIQDILSDE